MDRKDYYKVLGITEEEKKLKGKDFEKILKTRYRNIALSKHPDRMQGASDDEKKRAEAEFKEASEAYDTLLNHREEYDNPNSGFEGSGFDFGRMNVDEILRRHFSDEFSRFGFNSFNMGRQQETVPMGASLRISVGFTLQDALNGGKKKVKYHRNVKCSHCGGSGMTPESKVRTCSTCGGRGMLFSYNGPVQMMRTCPTCGGKGSFVENPCPHCKGLGIETSINEIEVEIPKGAMEGMTLTYQGLGSEPPHGNGVNGNLLVVLREIENDKFVREDNNLIFDLEVNVIDAILGCEVNVTTLSGNTLKAKIPQGTADGQQLRFKGHGLPQYGTNNVGSMIGVVRIKIPNELNDSERKLLTKLKGQEHFRK